MSPPGRDAIEGLGHSTRGLAWEEPLLFERSRPGRSGVDLDPLDVPEVDAQSLLGAEAVRETLPELPELSEMDVVRHFTRLSTQNYAVELGLYPLGSCTMKYNPKLNEKAARLPGFAEIHPLQPPALAQGILGLMANLEDALAEISGMDRVSLQPAAGAQGELAGIMMIRALHEQRGDRRKKVLIPDSAHGTNPASAALNDFECVPIPSGPDGVLHPEAVAELMAPDVAGLMLTNPNTLGLFEEHIIRICEIVHEQGGLVYGDGANLNALMGVARLGDMGIDVIHFNLHKTFSTPHGGGGPGAGPVGVKNILAPHLPVPIIRRERDPERYSLDYEFPHSIGRLHGGFGNVGMLVRAWAYIRSLGPDGVRRCAEMAVLNANYLLRAVGPPPGGDGRHHTGCGQAADRLRLPPADHLLPADRPRGDHDRAHGERVLGGPRSLRGGPARHRARGARDPRPGARGPAPHAPLPSRRDPRGEAAGPALAARGFVAPGCAPILRRPSPYARLRLAARAASTSELARAPSGGACGPYTGKARQLRRGYDPLGHAHVAPWRSCTYRACGPQARPSQSGQLPFSVAARAASRRRA
jgi:glycine dehydrogenase subunit 2